MIDSVGGGGYDVTCDDCGMTKYYHVYDGWAELMEEMKRDGWTKRKHGDTWEHTCIACEAGGDE